MKIYKISQAAFQTFGVDNIISDVFIKAINDYINEKGINKIRKMLESPYIPEIEIERRNITNELKPIFKHYGKPNTPPPIITFVIAGPKSKWAKKHSSAFFQWVNSENASIGIIMKNFDENYISSTLNKENIQSSIRHEFQHLLKGLYENDTEMSKYFKHFDDNKQNKFQENYYSNPWEIQAYSEEISKKAMDLLEEIFYIKIADLSHDSIKKLLQKIDSDRSLLVSVYLVKEIKDFLSDMPKKHKVQLNDEIKEKYFRASMRSFDKLITNFIQEEYHEIR
ncbi:MAG TPA: hypothetical protein VMZ91_14230 [Candidatus Paceibacterota bacterium]|nr:hypothetical protein [Candidatus Paceibacterota bacterium]